MKKFVLRIILFISCYLYNYYTIKASPTGVAANQRLQILLQENERHKCLLELTCVVLVALCFIGLLLFRQQHIIKQKNRQLQLQNDYIQQQADKLNLMLQELHHRVKNNLAIVSSLLNMQSYNLQDERAIQVVQQSQQRIEAIALIHQQLCQTATGTAVNMQEYVNRLVENSVQIFGFQDDNLSLSVSVTVQTIDIDLAVSLGLILNELMTNVFKHAYKGIAKPQLKISLQEKDGLLLEVQDNGIGIDVQEWEQKKETFGKQLIQSLIKQVSGQCRIEGQQGTYFSLWIPNK